MYPVCFISLSILDAEAYFDIYFEEQRDPDALPPKTISGRLLRKTAPFFRFFKSPQGFLALRSGIVSVAMWVPAVCPQTAWFYYDNKGIWALIMAQVGRVLILSRFWRLYSFLSTFLIRPGWLCTQATRFALHKL